MKYLGDFIAGSTHYFNWNTFGTSGQSLTRSVNGTISVYKDDGTSPSTAGITDTEDFNSLTGLHNCKLILTDAFYAAGHDYSVVVSAMTVDGQAINCEIAYFSVENRNIKANLVQIEGLATNDNLATLKLKKLDIQNSAGTALLAKSTGSNGNGIEADGNGLGIGILAVGGAMGDGISGIGGSSSGVGIVAMAQANGLGMQIQGADVFAGIGVTGGSTGAGMRVEAGGGDANGLECVKAGLGKDIDANEIDWLKNVQEGDSYIDKTTTPYQLVIHKKGDALTEYIRKNLKDIDGTNITNITQIIGKHTEPA